MANTISSNKKNSFLKDFVDHYGVGTARVKSYCKQKGVNTLNLTKFKVKNKINVYVKNKFENTHTSVKLREFIKKNLTFFWDNRLYRGYRYHFKLPCRGQRTHTNAVTTARVRI